MMTAGSCPSSTAIGIQRGLDHLAPNVRFWPIALVPPHMSAFGRQAGFAHITHLITSGSSAKIFINDFEFRSGIYFWLCREEHISGSRVLGLTGEAVAKEFCKGPELWPRRRLDRVMEANDGNRAFYRPQYSGVRHSHRCPVADLFGPRTGDNESDTF